MSRPQLVLFAGGLVLLFCTLVYREPAFRETYRYSIQGLSLLPIFYFAVRFHDKSIFMYLNHSLVKKLGVYSYTIYLIHDVIILFIYKMTSSDSRVLVLLLSAAISITYAAIVYSHVEAYFQKMRRKLLPMTVNSKIGLEESGVRSTGASGTGSR